MNTENTSASFQNLISTFTPTIFPWSFYCDFPKILKNTFEIKVNLNILNSLIGESDIDVKFLKLIEQYPEIRVTLPILLAVRKFPQIVFDEETKKIIEVWFLFDQKYELNMNEKSIMLDFFKNSWLKKILEDKNITNLNNYVFGVEAWLDSHARKNRGGTLMEKLVSKFIEKFCTENSYAWKEQATTKWINENWGITIESDKTARRFDFAIYDGKRVYLFETNFFGDKGSKLKSVAGEFSWLFHYLEKQNINLIWITDGHGWKSTVKSLEEAYNATNGNIYNIEMLKNWILYKLIK
jgi:type II restriction enzyme